MEMNETLKILYSQIGNEAFRMIGAKDLTFDNEKLALKFTIMRNESKIKYIRVQYMYASDTYSMQFYSSKGKLIEEIEDVHFNELHFRIEKATGLSTRLPNITNL